MATPFVAQQIRRCNRNLLLTNLVILAVLLFTAFMSRRYLFNFCFGPATFEKRDLRWNLDVDRELFYYVTVDGDQVLQAGGQDVIRRRHPGVGGGGATERASAYYVPLVVGDRLLLVKSVVEKPQSHLTGTLVPIPPSVQNGYIEAVEREVPELQGRFLPYMLDTVAGFDFRVLGYIELIVGLPLLGLSLWNLQKVFRRMTAATAHPIAQALSRFGPIAEVEASITAEVAGPSHYFETSRALLTRSYLLRASTFGLLVIHVDELVWVYQETRKYYWSPFPAAKAFTAIVYHRAGAEGIDGNESEVQKFLKLVAEHAPWTIVGYSAELAHLWKQDAAAVVRAVGDRLQQFRGQGDAAVPPAGERAISPGD
jgi:hypothetical protein